MPVGKRADPNRRIHEYHSSGVLFQGGLFTTPGHVLRIRLGSDQRPEALGGGMPNQCFQAQTNRVGVGGRATSGFSLGQKSLVDMKRLLHMYDLAILIWQEQ